jgi:3-hydroxyisobutyrate dehydrogenase-like beta-hydroxyacid dehydrogenase
MGARAKLATNLVLGLNRAALAEGMAFAEALGIGRAAFLAMVDGSPAASPAALAKGRKMVASDWVPESRIRQHLKDVGHMMALAGAARQDLPLTAAHAKLLEAAVAAGDGELDNAAILRRWEKA